MAYRLLRARLLEGACQGRQDGKSSPITTAVAVVRCAGHGRADKLGRGRSIGPVRTPDLISTGRCATTHPARVRDDARLDQEESCHVPLPQPRSLHAQTPCAHWLLRSGGLPVGVVRGSIGVEPGVRHDGTAARLKQQTFPDDIGASQPATSRAAADDAAADDPAACAAARHGGSVDIEH